MPTCEHPGQSHGRLLRQGGCSRRAPTPAAGPTTVAATRVPGRLATRYAKRDSNTQGVDARDAAAMAAMQRANNAGGTSNATAKWKHLAHVKKEAAAKGSTARPPQIAL